jgi:hypothetical protein
LPAQSVPQRTRPNDDTRYLQLTYLSDGSQAEGSSRVRAVRITVHPTADAGCWPMSYSDLEHFPFDEHDEPEGRQRPSGASRAPSPNESAPPASRDAKIFRDDGGVTWWVHEVNGEYLGAVGTTCLLVVSANELRRVWKYPADWRSLSAEELLRLPQQAPRTEPRK